MIHLLQTQANLNETVNQLAKSSLELAEATANLGALKVMAGIFLAFMILLIILFFYQLFSMSHKVDDIKVVAEACGSYLRSESDRTLGKAQSQVLIRRSFSCLAGILKYRILRIRLENHIENREATVQKVNMVIKNEISEMKTFLSNYICEGVPLSHVIEDEDINLIKEFVMEQIYVPKDVFTISNMGQSVDIFINGIKLDYINKVGIE